ncbi:MAG: peptide deformylase [Bacteroidales bacterium]|jgi:peptide deformylase|nr:peptide deformylase [Bacteroidales bacterium]
MKKLLLITVISLFIMSSCSQKYEFSENEKSIINEADEYTPFRVLLTTNLQDSILLRSKSHDFYDWDSPDFEMFIKRLKKTLIVEKGVGIAAPQVGIPRNIFLLEKSDTEKNEIIVVINPKIINHPEETICFQGDGCLSVPEITGNSVRYPWVDVEYNNEKGELVRERLDGYSRESGFNAVIFQHEFDHLQGILFTDKLCD